MHTHVTVVFVLVLINMSICRDFYMGMFKKNDLLVAQDRLYKEKVPYRHVYAKYGRIFKCKITYMRIADRLGSGPSPNVEIVRGGLNHKYVVVRLTSNYDMPVSVNIYVGCANRLTNTVKTTTAQEATPQTQQTLQVHDNDTSTTISDDPEPSTVATAEKKTKSKITTTETNPAPL